MIMLPITGDGRTLRVHHDINGAVRLSESVSFDGSTKYGVETGDSRKRYFGPALGAAISVFTSEVARLPFACGYATYAGLLPPKRDRSATLLDTGRSIVDATHELSAAAVRLSTAVADDGNPILAAQRALNHLAPAFAQIAGAILELETLLIKAGK